MPGRPPQKPHRRSLDALFPAPKPKPVKRCRRGHAQTPDWRPMQGCSACALYEAASERIRNYDAAKEREEWATANPVGPVLTMRIVSTGRLITYSIPKHLRPKRRRGRALSRRL